MTEPATIPHRRLSTRLLRKGALIEDTYRVFQAWESSQTVRENLHRIRETNPIGAPNESWLKEITATLSSRFCSESEVQTLALLAKRGLPLPEWKAFLLWHVGQTDSLYFRFGTEWLFDCHRRGLHNLRTEAVVPFVRQAIPELRASGQSLSDYGLVRGARDLLRMATDFGLLQGKAIKNFAAYQMPEVAFLYVLHALAEREPNCRKILEHPEWRLFLLDPGQVEREILNLHQFRKLEYHSAGSLAQLKLGYKTAAAYVESQTR